MDAVQTLQHAASYVRVQWWMNDHDADRQSMEDAVAILINAQLPTGEALCDWCKASWFTPSYWQRRSKSFGHPTFCSVSCANQHRSFLRQRVTLCQPPI